MKKSAVLFIVAFFGILLFPIHAFAVDFTINESQIDAYLQDNGNVQVTESHSYVFDGDFNGITRGLIPKDNTSITDFKATENGTPLEVELDDEVYKIFRSGEDEHVTIELSYLITSGVEVYADMAQFYWPFFDSNNESDYENLTISIHPPQATSDVIAYGFDEAYGTETIQGNGVVDFHMGFVDSGEKGNIRVAYDSALFSPAAGSHNGTIRDELISEQQELINKQAAFLERQEVLEQAAPYITGGFGLFLLLLLIFGWRKRQTTKLDAERRYTANTMVPKDIMSMPATIHYFRSQMAGYEELLTATMMDLVRKGNIETLENETYQLVDPKTDLKHEAQLIHLLFKKVGKDDIFSFEQLENYTKNTKNQSTLHTDLVEIQKSVTEEINSHHLFDKHVKLRWMTGIISLLLIPLLILFGVHHLFMWLFVNIIIMGALLSFAFLFQPRTVKGHIIKQQWQQFKINFSDIQSNSWYTLSKDDKERALIFSAGLKDQKLIDKNKFFIENNTLSQDNSSVNLLLLFSLFTTANVNFGAATQTFAGSSTGSSSGTGVGGGGGGSGAF